MLLLWCDRQGIFEPREGAVALKIAGREAMVCANVEDRFYTFVWDLAEYTFRDGHWLHVIGRAGGELIVEPTISSVKTTIMKPVKTSIMKLYEPPFNAVQMAANEMRPACAACGQDGTERCPYCDTVTCGGCAVCEHAILKTAGTWKSAK